MTQSNQHQALSTTTTAEQTPTSVVVTQRTETGYELVPKMTKPKKIWHCTQCDTFSDDLFATQWHRGHQGIVITPNGKFYEGRTPIVAKTGETIWIRTEKLNAYGRRLKVPTIRRFEAPQPRQQIDTLTLRYAVNIQDKISNRCGCFVHCGDEQAISPVFATMEALRGWMSQNGFSIQEQGPNGQFVPFRVVRAEYVSPVADMIVSDVARFLGVTEYHDIEYIGQAFAGEVSWKHVDGEDPGGAIPLWWDFMGKVYYAISLGVQKGDRLQDLFSIPEGYLERGELKRRGFEHWLANAEAKFKANENYCVD